jgi:hypothetical protein
MSLSSILIILCVVMLNVLGGCRKAPDQQQVPGVEINLPQQSEFSEPQLRVQSDIECILRCGEIESLAQDVLTHVPKVAGTSLSDVVKHQHLIDRYAEDLLALSDHLARDCPDFHVYGFTCTWTLCGSLDCQRCWTAEPELSAESRMLSLVDAICRIAFMCALESESRETRDERTHRMFVTALQLIRAWPAPNGIRDATMVSRAIAMEKVLRCFAQVCQATGWSLNAKEGFDLLGELASQSWISTAYQIHGDVSPCLRIHSSPSLATLADLRALDELDDEWAVRNGNQLVELHTCAAWDAIFKSHLYVRIMRAIVVLRTDDGRHSPQQKRRLVINAPWARSPSGALPFQLTGADQHGNVIVKFWNVNSRSFIDESVSF